MLEDVLRETPAYQWIKEEWLSKGIEEGMLKGIEEGKIKGIETERQARIEGLNQVITRLIQERFPQLLAQVQQRVAQIEQPEQLQSLLVNIGVANTADDILQALEI